MRRIKDKKSFGDMSDEEVRKWGESVGIKNCDKKNNFISQFRYFSSVGWGDVLDTPAEWLFPCLTCKHCDTHYEDGYFLDRYCKKYNEIVEADDNKKRMGSHVAHAKREDDCWSYELDITKPF